MHTGSKFTSFAPNQLIEIDDLQGRFFDYLDEQAKDLMGRVYDGPGVFGTLGFDLSTPGSFDIVGSSFATDGIGHLLSTEPGIARCVDVAYEDAPGIAYEVSLTWSSGPWVDDVENTVRSNADTGAPEYIARMNFIGEAGEPDAVQLVGDDIVFTIDSLCEAGVSHAGREALVYLVNSPQASTSAIALPILTVAYVGGLNKITVIANKLGQATASTNVSHYRVIVLGPTVRRNSSKLGVSGYVVLGSITDDDADVTSQHPINVSLSNINDAFNSFAQSKPIAESSAGPKASLPTARWGCANVEYDGKVLVFGGSQSYPLQNINASDIQAYDPELDSWSVKAAVFADAFTAQMSACRVGDIVYIAGGHDGSTVTDKLRRYDANADAFLSDGATMPAARHAGALVSVGAYLYYIAGDTSIPQLVAPQVTVYKYSIDSDQWSAVASLPVAKSRPNAVVQGSKIYVLGGVQADLIISPESYVFDTSTNAWSLLAPEPWQFKYPSGTREEGPFRSPAVALINGAVHLVTGRGHGASSYSYHHAYSIAANEWSVLPAPQLPNTFSSAHGAVNGKLYMFGGVVRNGVSSFAVSDRGYAVDLSTVSAAISDGCAVDAGSSAETPATASSELLDSLSVARSGHSICKLGNGWLITGGFAAINGIYTASAEMFWPATRTSCQVANMPNARALHGSVQYGARVVVLSGRIEEDLGDDDIWSFDPSSNVWSVDVVNSGLERASYSLAVQGSVAYLIAGTDHSPAPVLTETVEAFDLATMRSHGIVAKIAAALDNGCATILDDVLYHAVETVIQATKVAKLDDEDNADSATNFWNVRDVVLPAAVKHGGVAAYNGSLYIYEPGNGRILRYYPRDHEFEIVATGLLTRYRASFFVEKGRAYILGGSTVVGLTDSTDSVQEVTLPSVPYFEQQAPNLPTNFSTKKRGDSVGFKAGDVYGSIGWDRFDVGSFTRLTIAL